MPNRKSEKSKNDIEISLRSFKQDGAKRVSSAAHESYRSLLFNSFCFSFRHFKATGCSESKASAQWEFDFVHGKPAKIQKNFDWEAMPCDEVPRVYRVNHVKRLLSVSQNNGFEGQLPKLRYYHHIKKIEPQEVNNNSIMSVKSHPITASSKKNSSKGQLKITGKSVMSFLIHLNHQRFCVSVSDKFLFSLDFLKEKKRLTVTTKKKQ